jgi:CRISPR/Cas system CSM-associated protein Csm4 (group 5 of RAMP superfamily)
VDNNARTGTAMVEKWEDDEDEIEEAVNQKEKRQIIDNEISQKKKELKLEFAQAKALEPEPTEATEEEISNRIPEIHDLGKLSTKSEMLWQSSCKLNKSSCMTIAS